MQGAQHGNGEASESRAAGAEGKCQRVRRVSRTRQVGWSQMKSQVMAIMLCGFIPVLERILGDTQTLLNPHVAFGLFHLSFLLGACLHSALQTRHSSALPPSPLVTPLPPGSSSSSGVPWAWSSDFFPCLLTWSLTVSWRLSTSVQEWPTKMYLLPLPLCIPDCLLDFTEGMSTLCPKGLSSKIKLLISTPSPFSLQTSHLG